MSFVPLANIPFSRAAKLFQHGRPVPGSEFEKWFQEQTEQYGQVVGNQHPIDMELQHRLDVVRAMLENFSEGETKFRLASSLYMTSFMRWLCKTA